jgi:catechol 2,3-dioxygenase-like lactoylglutathione lyase family enzyme
MEGFKITGMDHIVLNVQDIDRALAFYVDVLGLEAERVEEFRKGEVGFPSVRINEGTIIDLFPLREAPANEGVSHNLNHFCMVAEQIDFDALLEHLERNDVTVTQRPVSRWGARGRATSIYVLDPDANEVEIRSY